MAFLRIIRPQHPEGFHASRRRQRDATDIAASCGYNHIGEFSAASERVDGSSPREALHREPAA
ncbi:MAG: hypothetical protein ACJ8DP_09870 [Microvirga sp.]